MPVHQKIQEGVACPDHQKLASQSGRLALEWTKAVVGDDHQVGLDGRGHQEEDPDDHLVDPVVWLHDHPEEVVDAHQQVVVDDHRTDQKTVPQSKDVEVESHEVQNARDP